MNRGPEVSVGDSISDKHLARLHDGTGVEEDHSLGCFFFFLAEAAVNDPFTGPWKLGAIVDFWDMTSGDDDSENCVEEFIMVASRAIDS